MRSRTTKFLAVLLAVVMMFSLGTQAFAVEVSNTLQGNISAVTGSSQTGESNASLSEENLPLDKQFIAAGKQLLADWDELTDDEKSDRAAYVMELRDELLEADEDSWDEEVYTVMADLESLSGGTETMWVGGASDRYQKFALFSLTEQPWDYGWNRKIPQSTIDNAAKYIYPRTYSVTYNGAKTYIGYVQMFIKPGAYSLNLTEAGELAGGKWDATVSSGKNYTYTAKSGNPRVEKVTVDTGYGSDWTYINLSNLKLGDVIQVNAYQDYYYLKVGNPMVKIYRDSLDVTGRNIQVDAGETINLNAMGFLEENVTAAGPITFSSSNTSLATVDSRGTVKILGEGTVTITASWVSNNGYFNASNKVTFNVEDPAKRVASISVKDYQPTYHWNETFNKQQGTIVATMGDGSTKEVPLASASDIYGFSSDTIGQKTITVWYEGCKATFPVTVAYEPAKISVAVTDPAKYGQTKTGKITVTGDADFVTLPDGTKVKPDDLTDYVFPDNGTYKFTVTGMDGETDSCTVNISVIDKEAPSLTVSYTGGKLSISTQDNLSGIHTIEYVDEVFTESTAAKWVSSPKTITDTLTGVADGIYGVVVTDHAGNSKSYDFKVGGTITAKPDFSVYVPSNIVLVINEDGTVAQAPSDAKIYNGVETLPICVTGIKVTTSQGWSLVDYNTNFTSADKDAKKLALSINGVPVGANGSVSIDRRAWTIAADGSLDLNLDVKAPAQTEKKTLSNVLKVTFDADWYDESLIPGERHEVTLQNVANATIKGTARTLYTDVYGRIPALPRVTPNTYYVFKGWVRTDTNAQVNVGDVISGNVTVKPVIDLADGYFIVNFASGGNGTVDKTSAIVKSGTAFSAIKPTAIPSSGYELDGWYNSSNSKVADSYSVVNGQTFTAKFKVKALQATEASVPSSMARVRSVAYGNGVYVALKGSSSGSDFWYSRDGKTWQTGALPVRDIEFNAVTYGNGKFVAVADGSNVSIYSTNGINWRVGGNLPESGNWSGIVYDGTRYVASQDRYQCAYSTNGINWTGQRSVGSNAPKKIVYLNGKYAGTVANWIATSHKKIYYIPNSTDTSFSSVTMRRNYNDIAAGNGKFVAAGDDGYIAYSTNGSTWTEVETGASGSFKTIGFGSGKFLAINYGGKVWTSEDGVSWKEELAIPASSPNTVVYGDGRWIVSFDNRIYCLD